MQTASCSCSGKAAGLIGRFTCCYGDEHRNRSQHESEEAAPTSPLLRRSPAASSCAKNKNPSDLKEGKAEAPLCCSPTVNPGVGGPGKQALGCWMHTDSGAASCSERMQHLFLCGVSAGITTMQQRKDAPRRARRVLTLV